MPNSQRLLGLIIKSTRQCNLRCSYCHDWRSRKDVMPFPVLATLTAKALGPENRRVEFIWHGGEPLLLGRDYYLKALRLQQEFRQEGQTIRNSLQTNGTLLDERWCELFKQFGFSIGISLDGPEEIHNLNRSYASGKGSYANVRNAIELLKNQDIPFGVLMVLNHKALQIGPERLFDFFINELRVNAFAFLPVRPDNVPGYGETTTTDYVEPTEYVRFMKAIFDHWYALDNPSIRIRELTSLLNAIVGASATVCTLAGHCLGQYYHVEANGDLYHCDKYLGDPAYNVGNIMHDSFQEIRGSAKMEALITAEEQHLQSLSRCASFNVCHGGCPHDRYIAAKYSPEYDGTCCGIHELISHIRDRVEPDLARARRFLETAQRSAVET